MKTVIEMAREAEFEVTYEYQDGDLEWGGSTKAIERFANLVRADERAKLAEQPAQQEPEYTYASTQATRCARCGEHKHTPLRIDSMAGYVCLTCIDKQLCTFYGEFGYPEPAQQEPVAWNDEQLQMLNFLYGAGDFDGVWFDQKHPTEKGAFWWRKHLRRLFDTPQAQPDRVRELECVIADLKAECQELRAAQPAQQEPLTGGDERRHIICLCPDCTKTVQQEPVGTVKELFKLGAWEKVDVKGSTKVYLHAAPQPAQQEPVYVQTRHKEEHGFSEWGSLLDPTHRNSKWAEGVEMRLLYTAPQAQENQS